MTSISQINASISDHKIVANAIAACLVLFGVFAWNAVVYQNGDIAKTYDNLLQPFATTQTPANETAISKVQTVPEASSTSLTLGKSAPLSLQNQPQSVVTELQPAQTTTLSSTISVSSLQPSANSIQLTGVNPQQATASIQ
jgi:hypothetical protein